MTYYVRSGSRFSVTSENALDIHQALPAATYTVKFDQFTSTFFLEIIDNFEVGGKIYGDTNKTTDRILRTFASRDNSTGVMLTGEKGSGKTLQAKILSVEARKAGIPTIVINAPWCGEAFNVFIQSIEQPTVILFDEFEKVYGREEQEQMLTLLDGVYPSKKLFVLTCNDKYRVNEHMKNRPGRIFYRVDYTGLPTDFIVEYCEDNLKNLEHVDALCRLATAFGEFNFDILKAMVEEMNRYGETPAEVINVLNARPEYSEASIYDASLSLNGAEVKGVDKRWRGNPLTGEIRIDFLTGDDDWDQARFSVSDLRKVEAKDGQFLFANDGGYSLALSKKRETSYDWAAY